ncbi:universal stress protein [Aequorivita marina]|uniref:universal stress protein n=1 Tax=Aequorivita marina TaxID=3073654 RepID=UPI002876E324|nr:universal stress protein [Aequorivita sp. S2608]MDS1298823.1 universal stress protein [Aequorivita sp. S2608]
MKNILLPTDFSKNAYNAIEYAVQLFENEDCTFHLLNTFTPVSYSMSTFADGHSSLMLEELTRRTSENRLAKIEEGLIAKFNNPKHTFLRSASFNLLTQEIEAVIKERNIDLVVMGTKGATGAREVFLGTNTMFTIKKVNCPVIGVPEGFTYEKPKKVVFPTEFKFSLKNKNLELVKSICANHEAELNILNISFKKALNKKQEEVKQQFEAFLNDNSYVLHNAEYANLVETIEQFQIQQKINFLVMIKNKPSFFENLLFKPVIKKIVYHTNIPFMVFPSMKLMKS